MQQQSPMKEPNKVLKEIAFEMSVLLVEDDTILQEQIKIFLARFFGSVETAYDGIDALKKYKQKKYDLILSDLTMPRMGGIVLTQEIKGIDDAQKIIIISAHSESEKLIDLINLGVDGFLLKPLNVANMMTQLTKVCHAIYDQKMLHYFSQILEETNHELKKTNIELESALSEIKYCKAHREHHARSEITDDEHKQSDPSLFYTTHQFEINKANENLEDLEYLFNLFLLNKEQYVSQNNLRKVEELLAKYIAIIEQFSEFKRLVHAMKALHNYLHINATPEILLLALPTITNLFDDLEQWRKGLFEYQNSQSIFFMDDSILENIANIIEHKY